MIVNNIQEIFDYKSQGENCVVDYCAIYDETCNILSKFNEVNVIPDYLFPIIASQVSNKGYDISVCYFCRVTAKGQFKKLEFTFDKIRIKQQPRISCMLETKHFTSFVMKYSS